MDLVNIAYVTLYSNSRQCQITGVTKNEVKQKVEFMYETSESLPYFKLYKDRKNITHAGWTCYVLIGNQQFFAQCKAKEIYDVKKTNVLVYTRSSNNFEPYDLADPQNGVKLLQLIHHMSDNFNIAKGSVNCPSNPKSISSVSLTTLCPSLKEAETTWICTFLNSLTRYSPTNARKKGLVVPRLFPLRFSPDCELTLVHFQSSQVIASAIFSILRYKEIRSDVIASGPDPLFQEWLLEKISHGQFSHFLLYFWNEMKCDKLSFQTSKNKNVVIDDLTLMTSDVGLKKAMDSLSKSVVRCDVCKGNYITEVRLGSNMVAIVEEESEGAKYISRDLVELVDKIPSKFKEFYNVLLYSDTKWLLSFYACFFSSVFARDCYVDPTPCAGYNIWKTAFLSMWYDVTGTASLLIDTFKIDSYRAFIMPGDTDNIKINSAKNVNTTKQFVKLSVGTVLLTQIASDHIIDGFCRNVYNVIEKLEKENTQTT